MGRESRACRMIVYYSKHNSRNFHVIIDNITNYLQKITMPLYPTNKNSSLNIIITIEYAEAYVKRFLDVKDDFEFLNFISKNARKYYETYLHPSTNLKHVFNLLEINK